MNESVNEQTNRSKRRKNPETKKTTRHKIIHIKNQRYGLKKLSEEGKKTSRKLIIHNGCCSAAKTAKKFRCYLSDQIQSGNVWHM